MRQAHGLLSDHDPPSIALLEDWCDRNGIIRSDGLAIVTMPDNQGWTVRATRPVNGGETLCQIPKSAILSAHTTTLVQLHDTAYTPGGSQTTLHLALVVLHELRMGRESRFYGYLQSLPRATSRLPLFWNVDELAGEDGRQAWPWLRGTEADRDLERRQREGVSLHNMRSFYSLTADQLPATRDHPQPSPFLAFLHAFSLVSTRAFLIDLYHTVALCPFADLFNHSADSHTSLASDEFVCHICGSMPSCQHDRLGESGIAERLSHLSSSVGRKLAQEDDDVEMRAERRIDAGEEVFNCYGELLGDCRLLVEWGFIAEEFVGEGMQWPLSEIIKDEIRFELYKELSTDQQLRDRIFGETAKISPNDEEQLICPSSRIQPDLLSLTLSAQMSLNLFLALFVDSRDHERITYDEARSLILTNMDVLALVAPDQDDKECFFSHLRSTDIAGALSTVERAVALFDSRLASMYQPETTIEELLAALDSLPPAATLQHMAISVTLNERKLLHVARERWKDVRRQLADAMHA